MSPSEVLHKRSYYRHLLFCPLPCPPHLREISVHVLSCNGRIRDELKQLPHGHDSHAALQKETCPKENVSGSFARGMVITPTILQRNKEIKTYHLPEMVLSITASNNLVPTFCISSWTEYRTNTQTGRRKSRLLLTVDIGTVFPQELQGMWVVMLHRLRHIYDVHTAATVPVGQTPVTGPRDYGTPMAMCGGRWDTTTSLHFLFKKFYFQMKKRKKKKDKHLFSGQRR